MNFPKVSIIWINYNSSKFIGTVLGSLDSLLRIYYPNFEIIIIDNCSTDNSLGIIRSFLDNINPRRSIPSVKIMKLNYNTGFTGGNFIGYKYRSKDSKYTAIINNDFIVKKASLLFLVDYLDKNNSIGAIQGKITKWDRTKIESCGFLFDSMYRVYARGYNFPVTTKTKESTVSYVSGAYSVYRNEAIEKCGGLFGSILPYFGYFDDADLCLRLWRLGYKICYVPILSGQHKNAMSFSNLNLKHYLNGRNRIATLLNFKGRKRIMALSWIIYFLSRTFLYLGLGLFKKEYLLRSKYTALMIIDGILLSRKTKKIKGEALEPFIKLNISTIIKRTFLGGIDH
jgi:GT2 family glycosyltransferase